jgi:hypothetical protein
VGADCGAIVVFVSPQFRDTICVITHLGYVLTAVFADRSIKRRAYTCAVCDHVEPGTARLECSAGRRRSDGNCVRYAAARINVTTGGETRSAADTRHPTASQMRLWRDRSPFVHQVAVKAIAGSACPMITSISSRASRTRTTSAGWAAG